MDISGLGQQIPPGAGLPPQNAPLVQPPQQADPRTGQAVQMPVYKVPQYAPNKVPKQGDIPDMAGEALQYKNSGKPPPWALPRTTESQSNGVKVYEFPLDPKSQMIGTPEWMAHEALMHKLLKETRPGDKVLFHDSKGAQIWLENTVDPDGGKLDSDINGNSQGVDPERASYWGSWFPPEAGM